ncbi:hypothetical protein [Ruegeria sp.]|uniref:hypothetical protein n=1 Tax=Ruegeria sp. TaxID=1879320 RepID=UPI003B00FC1A
MFPLNSPTVFSIALAGVALISAIAFRFDWRVRAPLMLASIALPTGLLVYHPMVGQYAGQGYLIVILSCLAMFALGAGWGSVMRLVQVSPFISVSAPVIVTCAYTGHALWLQYVPKDCLKEDLHVRIAGEVVVLPPELKPRLEIGNSATHFGRMDRKSGFSKICRLSQNGTRAIDMDVVWITPASNHAALTSLCEGNDEPEWCGRYSSYPYRHVGKVLFATEDELGFPKPYWKEGGSLKKERQGDLKKGSICLLSDEGTKTQCWTWQPFGEGSRLTVSANNLDPIFVDMPVDEARNMALQALNTTLSIVQP